MTITNTQKTADGSEKTPKRRGWCLGLSVGIVGTMAGLVVLLFSVLGGVALRNEQALINERNQFYDQYELWQRQNLQDYTVRYSSCHTGLCCENVQIEVRDNILQNSPDCMHSQYHYQDYNRLNTVSETYEWVANFIRYYEDNQITLSYDPDWHYITRIEFEPAYSAPILIEYSALQPIND